MRLRNSASSASGTLLRKGRTVLPSDATAERAADEDPADIIVFLKKRDWTSLPLESKAAWQILPLQQRAEQCAANEVTLILLEQFFDMVSGRCSKIF
jgi:hypothetical protein